MHRRSFFVSLGGGKLYTLGLPALAQTFPQGPVKILVAWPAVGIVDVTSREICIDFAVQIR